MYVSFNYIVCCLMCFFFFSSRRRHTRCLSDWSSDVCSSDLVLFTGANFPGNTGTDIDRARSLYAVLVGSITSINANAGLGEKTGKYVYLNQRSEERRVGKECRSRLATYDEKKKDNKKKEKHM